jgi:ubiquinone/menaquinone biosynthesis C-methylase UbiE
MKWVSDDGCGAGPGAMARVPLGQQKLVDAYFQSTVPEWAAIYQRKENLYARIYQQRRTVALSLVDRMALPQGADISEIGCGPGLSTVALAQRGYLVHAIDTVSAMTEATRKRARRVGLQHRVMTSMSDVRNLAFPDNSFQLVLMIGVTEWLDSLGQPLKEIARVIAPGGLLIVSSDNTRALHQLVDPILNPALAPLKKARRVIRRALGLLKLGPREYAYSIRQFNSLLAAAGFEIMEGVTVGFGPFSFFGRKLFSETTGLRINQKFQHWANAGVPVVRTMGRVYIVAAAKPISGT